MYLCLDAGVSVSGNPSFNPLIRSITQVVDTKARILSIIVDTIV